MALKMQTDFGEIDITNEKDMPKKEKVVIIEEPEEKPKKEKHLTMSDFFEEFKL